MGFKPIAIFVLGVPCGPGFTFIRLQALAA